jgi:energy-coupling factor transporter ATP-binding protein EcfA2
MNDRLKLRITHYPDVSVRTRAAGTILEFDSLADLGSHILDTATDVNEKGASGYWVAAPVDGVRSNANTRPTRVIALDWDDAGEPPEPTHSALRGLRYFAHTTDSHTADDPRWRVWVELDREYTPEEVGRAQSPIDGVYLRAASQPAYVPTRADEMEWISNDVVGRPLSLERWGATRPVDPPQPLDLATILSPQPRQPTLASTHALVARWLADPSGTNRLAGATGAVLAAWGWGDDAIAAWLHSLVGRADPKVAKHVSDALRAAATRRAGGTVPGLPTLEAELGVSFQYESSAVFDAAIVDPQTPDGGPEVDQNGWVTAAAIAAWIPPPVDWLVEGLALAPGAPVLLTGYGGSGKTTLAQHLAICVSSAAAGARSSFQSSDDPQGLRGPGRILGAPKVLGVLEVNRPGPVTHIDYEQGIELTARRYRDLGLAADSQLRFRAPPTSMPSLAGDDASRAWLADAARGQRLVLIDSFVAGLGAALDDENAAGVREPLDWLGRVSIETGAVVLVIHHSRKTQRGGDHRQTARGSSAITDAVSVHLNYERTADSGGAVLRAAKLRRSPPVGMLAGLLGDGVLVTPQLTLGRIESAATELGPQILTALAAGVDGGRGLKTADVCRALDLAPNGDDWRRVRTALDGLLADGTVRIEGEEKNRRWFLA